MVDFWPPGPRNPTLDLSTIHVWQAGLAVPADRLASYEVLLAGDERARASRFHFERDRQRYVVGRGILRLLIGRYLDRAPAALEFSYSHYGKPALPGDDLRFNLAHSGDRALFAFARGSALGVDLEEERPLPDAMGIARRFFSAAEQAALAALPEEQQAAAFFRCWTRKEAFIKAVGEGLSYPLDAFDVTLRPGEQARLLAIRGSAEEALRWTLWHLDPGPGYIGALAAQGTGTLLSRWQFPA